MTEEARHLPFARHYLKRSVPSLARLHRSLLAIGAPLVLADHSCSEQAGPRRGKDIDEARGGPEAVPMDGVVAGLYLSATAGGDMEHRNEIEVHAEGVVGDRYSSKSGSWSSKPASGRALTLIEEEAIEAVRRDYGIDLVAGATRRNVVTRGVALNHLVGRTFQVGEVEVVGVRLAEPCAHLESLTAKGVRRAFVHRGGLRGEVVSGGRMRVGDPLRMLEQPVVAD